MSELTKSFDAEKLISDKKENIKNIEIFFFQHFQKFDFRQKKAAFKHKTHFVFIKKRAIRTNKKMTFGTFN